jgi:cytoskeleton protein RodZ
MESEGQGRQGQPQGQPQDQRHASAPGATLAAQREAMGLSIEHIADQLKLAPRQVVAIEQGDFASLPNMAVTRGFIRAYAKVVRLDPAPLVAQIEVTPSVTATDHAPIRREKISTSFSESRFPTLTERGGKPKGWLIGGLVALVVIGGAAAWQSGLVTSAMFSKPATQQAVPTVAAPAVTTTQPAPAASQVTPLQSPNVPLVSTPPSPDNTAPLVTAPATGTVAVPGGAGTTPAITPATTPATAPATPAAATPAAAAATTPAAGAAGATPAPAAQGANTLVLTVTVDSWVEIRRPGSSPLISRTVKAGSTETFDIDRQATLIVGKPDGVRATLRGAPLALPRVAGGTISRVQIK